MTVQKIAPTGLIDLASRRLGGSVVTANDELFAERENLIKPGPAVSMAGRFGPKGGLYDGWETRRRRDTGHDYAIVRLGIPGIVRGVVIDTAFFAGNYPSEASVEACAVEGYPSRAELERASWVTLVPPSPLDGDAENVFTSQVEQRFTHVRLSIYPDGGVARFRVHGEAVPDPRLLAGLSLDLASSANGGVVTGCSNMFYSSPNNLLAPGLAANMGDGWETARRRDDDNDWVVVRLAGSGLARLAELDTTHFVGNAPGWARLRGCVAETADPGSGADWFDLLPRTRLQPDTRHQFRIDNAHAATHIRLDIYPDGGMARLRIHGVLTAAGQDHLALRWVNTLPDDAAIQILTQEGGLSADEVRQLLAARPLHDLPRPVRELLTPQEHR